MEGKGIPSIYEFAEGKFHISQPTATRFMNLCIEFFAGDGSAELDKKYEKFTVSQLVEMFPLKPGQKEKNGVQILPIFLWKMEGSDRTAALLICLTELWRQPSTAAISMQSWLCRH